MPTITNNLNLPAPLYRALAYDGYTPGKKKSHISVTALISSPLIFQLKKRHKDEIVEDAADRTWSLLGQSIHRILELAEDCDSIAERRLYMKIAGWILTGQTDLYEEQETEYIVNDNPNYEPDDEESTKFIIKVQPKKGGAKGVLSDFKVTSVFSFLLGQKEEWTQQVNLNAMLWRHDGFEVNRGQIVAILRDWQATKAKIDPTYPQCPIHIVNIPLWDQDACIAFASRRIKIHQEAAKLADDKITGCSEDERWRRGDAWAVMKVGNKKATKVFDSEDKAKEFLPVIQQERPKDKFEIVYRPGEDVKCVRFCTVSKWCKYFQENYAGKNIVNDSGEE